MQLKLSHCTKNRVINATHERSTHRLLLLVLLSQAAGGGRTAFTLKKISDAFPKSRQRKLAAFLLPPTAWGKP
ncbi:hypothetical protein [Stenotrophomonas sp. YIM B06876]|uniref:hypothetical protein n=1 Tax=Stenotrophomonas sp. YIM B06876 TaxID=3060211 RepID=UPI00273A009B|nr:hypothetical protein [Stenotrophomonas sp. YIM B06876]